MWESANRRFNQKLEGTIYIAHKTNNGKAKTLGSFIIDFRRKDFNSPYQIKNVGKQNLWGFPSGVSPNINLEGRDFIAHKNLFGKAMALVLSIF